MEKNFFDQAVKNNDLTKYYNIILNINTNYLNIIILEKLRVVKEMITLLVVH